MQDCVLNKSFEVTKEFKDFKFQQNLKGEYNKGKKTFNETIFVDPRFDSHKQEFSDMKIDGLLDKQHNDLSIKIEKWIHEGLNWSFYSILGCQLVILEITTCEASSYFPLPKELNNSMIGLINIQNEDRKCFRWCLIRYLNHVNKNSAIIRNRDREGELIQNLQNNLILKA